MNRRTFAHALALVPLGSLVQSHQAVATTSRPDMEPGQLYCLGCDEGRLLPERVSPEHVAVRFITNDERRHKDIYLHGEKVNRVYEALDGEWAIVGTDQVQCCGRPWNDGRLHVLVTFEVGPFEIRRT